MHAPPILTDILAILLLSVPVALLLHRLKLPVLVGYVAAGAAVGPQGLGWIRGEGEVALLSDIGVVLLLFTIGIEFSLEKLLQARRSVLIAGPTQLVPTGALGAGAAMLVGRPPAEALLWGALMALSSTAIPLRLLQQRAEVDSAHGRTALGIAIFQDLAVVPMMIILPLLASGPAALSGEGVARRLALAGVTVVAVVLLARWVVPRLFLQVARTKDREVFLLSVIAVGLGVAWVGSSLGLSLALGAFLAGLILSESDYGHQALASLLPFRDVFLSIFFVSIGMALDLRLVASRPFLVVGGVLAVVTAKVALATVAGVAAGLPVRSAVLAGLLVGQIGEFSLVLSREALGLGLLDAGRGALFLAVAVLTMAVTPFFAGWAPRLADAASRIFDRRGSRMEITGPEPAEPCRLVVVGFGLNGRNLALAAGRAGVGFAVVDMNPDAVREARQLGCRVVYGDATQPAVLHEAGVASAHVVVVAVSDPVATRGIVATLRELAPAIHIIVRTRYATDTKELLDLGADEVVPEEFETSVEIFSRVLRRFLVDEERIAGLRRELRAGTYGVFRSAEDRGSGSAFAVIVPETEIRTFLIETDSPLDGVSLAEADLRKSCGVSVLAVRRGDEVESNPDPGTALRAGESLVAFGRPDRLAALGRRTRAAG